MRIACLYFPTSSVGGIATNTAALRAEAKRRGDTFHVLISANVKSHEFYTHEVRRVRGGDTYIDVDGYAPHHATNQAHTIRRIAGEYDLIYLAFLCPHPTKSYTVPAFLPLLEELGLFLPVVGRISDGYWATYEEWGLAAAATCARMVVAMEPYLPPGLVEALPTLPIVYGRPFDPEPPEGKIEREARSVAWIAQWKAIKGIHRFLPLVPQLPGRVDLYSNGILYYQKRTELDWMAAIGEDRFQGFNGAGRATFHGWQPLPVIRAALRRADFMPEFQGMGKPRYAADRAGATNNTTMEALFYECTPVIPQIVIDSAGIPSESVIGIRSWDDIVPALSGNRAPRPDLGRQWVLDMFHVSMIYDRFFGGLL